MNDVEKFYLDTLAIKNIRTGNHYTYIAELYELYEYRMKDRERAEEFLERAKNDLPDNTRILLLIAEHYRKAGDSEKAKKTFETILNLDPENISAQEGIKKLN